jgi:hypothetical protein
MVVECTDWLSAGLYLLEDSTALPVTADREFVRAISILEEARLQEPLVGCLATYAAVLEKRGDTEGALAYLKRAVTVTRPDLAVPATPADGANQETA